MELMCAAWASALSASVSTFPNTTPSCLVDAASKVGANARQGPHHAAQKSTRTTGLSVTVVSNVAAVRFWVVMRFSFWLPSS